MTKAVALAIAVGAVLASGCTLAPPYVQPEAPVPDTWPTGTACDEASEEQGAPPPLELHWRDFLADPNLEAIVQSALASNRDLKLAALNVERARVLYGIQRAELYPTLYASATGGEERVSADFVAPGQPRTSEFHAVDLGVFAWEIDFFGRIRSLEAGALEAYLTTEQARHSVQILLVSSVADAYLTLAAGREALALSQRTFQIQQEAYEIVQQRYDKGVATELDLRRAQTPVEVARGDIARYTQLAAQAENALRLLVGAPVPDRLLPRELDQVAPPAQIRPGLSSEVLLSRPDILAAEHRLRGAYARIGAARAAFFPRISLTTTVGTASDELSNLFSSGTGTWSYGPQISMPIFDPQVWAAHRVSTVERDIAVAEYERAIQAAFREVADVLAVRETVDEQVAAQEALVDALAETYSLALCRYEAGVDSYLGVLDAQRSLFDAQQQLVSLRLLQRSNQIHLYAVLGGGWQSPSTGLDDRRADETPAPQ
ncbi:MAG: efflux transporter outer membrane subunit [Planctomycetes bacterium]|nr:efflux transporter outer membrane subunit [Planctomycetota bacterium]